MKLKFRHQRAQVPPRKSNGHVARERLPIDIHTGQPLGPMEQPG